MEMPQPDAEEATEPQGLPEGAEDPHTEPQGPQMPPPPDPMQVNTPENDVPEVEARDKLGLRLVLVAERMAEAASVASTKNDGKTSEAFASAAHKLVQAIVLITPVIAADDLTGNAGAAAPAPAGLASAERARVDQ